MLPTRPDTTSTQHTQSFPNAPENYFIRDFEINLQSPVYSTEYMPASGFFCLGCEDGVTRVLSTTKKAVQYSLVKEDKSPVTCIASTSATSMIKNTIMITHSGGTLQYWHATSNQILFQKKYDTQLQSCEISPNTEWYVISGENGLMYLGHLDKGNPSQLEVGQLGSHANRIFCIKWHPDDVNTFFSGGWDRTVFQWDVRTKTAVKNLYGFYIGGQCIDVRGNELLLGNNQNEKQLRVYDIKAQKMRNILWEHYDEASAHSNVGVNTCFFGAGQNSILTLSSRNQLRFFKDDKCLSLYKHPDQNARGYSMGHSPQDKFVVATWNNGDVKIMSY